MNIVIVTANERLYLPTFFVRFFRVYPAVGAVFITPPGHGKNRSNWNMAKKYWSAFGVWNFGQLAVRLLVTKVLDALGVSDKDKAYSVESAAKAYGIRCESIDNVNDESFLTRLQELKADLVVSVSCPQIFKRPLIEAVPRGILNIHGAPLPKYRGLLPSFWMMARGESQAAVTVFLVGEQIDAGDVVVIEHFDIGPTESLHSFIVRSKQIHCAALLKALEKMEAGGNVVSHSLDVDNGTYFGFPTREAYLEFKARGRRLW